MGHPTDLRVEHLDEPFGIDVRLPRLSWRLPDGAREQVAYQVHAGDWDSGRVTSAQSLLVPYGGPPLVSGQRVSWQVKVWTDLGESEWSESAWWEMGLLERADWNVCWIEPPERGEVRSLTPRPAYLLRSGFTLDGPVQRARLYATAHGIYELFLNGRRVGDMELTPGFTSYGSRLQVQTFDVAELLVPGENVLEAVLSDGWFRGQTSIARATEVYGDRVALLAQLQVHGTDGRLMCTGTGPDWVAATGAIVAADLMQGQVVDFRRAPGAWSPVVVRMHDLGPLCSSPAPPVRRVEELRPVALTRPRGDRHVVDLGQNVNGWIRLTNLGPAATTLTLLYGETLDAEGDVTLVNVDRSESPRPEAPNQALPLQVDRVTSDGTSSFEPRHSTKGFRYVRIEGHPGDVAVDDVTGVVVHSDLRRTGWFECSDERINRLHEAAAWTLRGNACDIPTDCPTRERAGFGGDWQAFVPSAAFLYDVAGFATKWLRDLAADQHPDGCVPHFAPDTIAGHAFETLIPQGVAGWGDAAVVVPWEIYRAYCDTRLLEEQWPSMTAWVEYAARAAREHRHPSRMAARPTAAPHEAYLWDTGFHFGEWLEPSRPEIVDADAFLASLTAADHGPFATAYLHRSAHLLAEMGSVLGREADEAHYRDLATATKAAWQAEFIRPDGTLIPDTQSSYVRALAFDLVPPALRPQLVRRLVELIREADTHVGTGILATAFLLPVLADTDHLDIAYELLLRDTPPSWFSMLEAGATTIWEHWQALDEHGLARHGSLNHYAFAAVVSFLHRYTAGIRLLDGEPAYRRFQIAPLPGGGITWARATLDSPYGRIESAWRIDAEELSLDVAVPPGTRAEVRLPDGQRVDLASGRASIRGRVRA
jgi:alpha-L-rhamnosidase